MGIQKRTGKVAQAEQTGRIRKAEREKQNLTGNGEDRR
jgi:hypothetical protein